MQRALCRELAKEEYCGLPTYLLRFLCCAVIAGLARKELEKYGLTGWYPTVVTDAGSNIAAAFDRPHVADWMRCCCHVLHNAVQHGWQVMRNCSHNASLRLLAVPALER